MPIDHTNRGFAIYGQIDADRYGQRVRVQASSLATEACVWIFTEGGQVNDPNKAPHLTIEQARVVRDALSEFIEENT